MSCFGDSNWEKNNIVEALVDYAKSHKEDGIREVMEEMMEAVSVGLDYAIGEVCEEKE
jgi:hypothetical protein